MSFPCVCSKDVRIPQELRRVMAAEAEASREAKAKVSSLCCVCVCVCVCVCAPLVPPSMVAEANRLL